MHREKGLLLFVLALLPYTVNAQWRVGVAGGATLNHYSLDKHYMEDWHYDDGWGTTVGIMGQYDFLKWKKWQLGVRTDLNYLEKKHKEYRTEQRTNYHITNKYIQLPIAANISWGGKVRFFAHIGMYGAYRKSMVKEGEIVWGGGSSTFTKKNDFDSKRDQRWDFGYIGGIGCEWLCWKQWSVQMEIHDFYSVTSTQKDYMRIKDPRYYNTIALQGGICWIF